MLRSPIALSLLICVSLCAHASDRVVLEPVLKNVEGVPSADLNAIIQDLNKTKYRDLDELAEQVRFVFQKYGYFTVWVADPVMPTARDVRGKKAIPVNLVVNAGKKYRIRDIGFGSSRVFSPGQLRAAFPIGDGDVFDRERVARGLESLHKLYGNRGYMDFSAVPETEVNDVARTISLRIDLDEGPLFYAGKLTVRGEESHPGARDRLVSAWKGYEGRVYGTQTLERFLRDLHARPGVRPEQVFEVSLDAEKHLANVFIYLAKPIF
jgi:outer membrane translocation and assembly module TamA